MRDDLSAIAGGVAGTAGIVVVLFGGDALTGYRAQTFADLAAFVGTQASPVVGLALFAVIGVFAWPLVYLSLHEYFPGGSDFVSGLVFSLPIWVGYAVVFRAADADTASLVAFLVVTLLGHLAYGGLLGLVYGRLGDHTLAGVS